MFVRLVVLFTVVPLVELYLLVEIGGLIGVWPTIALVLVTGVVGAALARHQGIGVFRRFEQALRGGEVPTEPLADGLLILVAAAVLLTPGLITDALGFVLLIPWSRAVVRRALVGWFGRRIQPADPGVLDATWRRRE
jgi:UPF0716 protein FxsA